MPNNANVHRTSVLLSYLSSWMDQLNQHFIGQGLIDDIADQNYTPTRLDNDANVTQGFLQPRDPLHVMVYNFLRINQLIGLTPQKPNDNEPKNTVPTGVQGVLTPWCPSAFCSLQASTCSITINFYIKNPQN
jgi:hypothetical protein